MLNTFYNFPGVCFYHFIYLANSLFKPSSASINGPGIYFNRQLKNIFPTIPNIWDMYCTTINEVQIIDTRQIIMTLLTASIPEYVPG